MRTKFQIFNSIMKKVMNFFLNWSLSWTTLKINIPKLTRLSSENEMCERFWADTLLSMQRTSFWSIINHMGTAILEISPEIMTFEKFVIVIVTNLC